MKVSLYRNLHKKGYVYSVRSEETKRIVDYVESILLQDVKFVVSKKGRERVLKEKRKNVHAFIKGNIIQKNISNIDEWIKIMYDPYKYSSFVDENGKEVISAEFVYVNKDIILASNILYGSDDATFNG